ncbi:sensor histidine kinase [Ideonella oryzae]|uniref:histidine kinase n=1 Tax=Ideonella oryzae TaxID=2937441 RepID=A0ABT1BQ59_9BURK|nr:hybrid sensor histidine kinase/response regulator [Ideonella oryzae]MCO5978362.1 ATP-binding protein [Ideonella oryzae]
MARQYPPSSDLASQPPPTATPPSPPPRSLWRLRLWRKQVRAFALLAVLSILVFGGMEVFFSYREAIRNLSLNQALLAREVNGALQAELGSIERHVRATASLPWELPGWLDDGDRRGEFQRILKLEPAVQELTHYDPHGRVLVHVSRNALSEVPGTEPAEFTPASRLRWPNGLPPEQGSIEYADGYEPQLLLVTPDPRMGAGVTVARVNLRTVARHLASVLHNPTLEAYAVDARGVVVVHADTTLMLAQPTAPQSTEEATAPAAGLSQQADGTAGNAARARAGLDGQPVLASRFAVPALGWQLVIEQPRNVALAPVYSTLVRTGVVILLAVAGAIVAAMWVVGRVSQPIRELHQGSQALAEGRLGTRITIQSNDELEDLAAQFNVMAANLQELYRDMSGKIAERTRDLELANRHKSEFLTNMSHELRTPLNSIIGFSDVLREEMFGPLNERQREYAHDIHASGEHLLSLINDVLDLSKIEAGHMELNLSTLEVTDLVQHTAAMMRERCTRGELTLKLMLDETPDTWVADARRVKQILLNLLGNAVKFTPQGGTISIRAGTNDSEGLWLEVCDTGVGIAPEHQAMVFEEFRQVGDDILRKSEGTGLGLPLVRRLVRLHGGDVTLRSVVGEGTTFRFNLPRLPDDEEGR